MHPTIYLLSKITLYTREGIPSLNSVPVLRQANEVPSLTAEFFKSLATSAETDAIHVASFKY